jgi:hypothetical protein
VTHTLAALYGLVGLATLVALVHAIDPVFVREVGDYLAWLVGLAP